MERLNKEITRRYLSDVSMDELRTVIAKNTPRQNLPIKTKSSNAQHDSLITTREPRQI